MSKRKSRKKYKLIETNENEDLSYQNLTDTHKIFYRPTLKKK